MAEIEEYQTTDKYNEHHAMMILSEKRDYKVVKANALIQRARYDFSAQEQKIVLYLISKIKPEDDNFKLYDFEIKEFCRICGIDERSGKNYADMKNTIKKLADKSIWVTLNENKDETLLRWIEKPYIRKKTGTIQIRLDRDMKPFLLQLKEQFTQYHLLYTLAMKGRYSIRLYELLKSYEYRTRYKFDIDDFKSKIGAEKYERHADFKRFVLLPALKEINTFGDITVTYSFAKTGKKITEIEFFIKLKKELDERLETWAQIEQKLNPKQMKGQISLWTVGAENEKNA